MNEEKLTPEEREKALESIAKVIHRYRLETPAVFFLEMHRPLFSLAGTASHMITPMIGAFLGMDKTERYASMLSDRSTFDDLINKLDAQENGASDQPD